MYTRLGLILYFFITRRRMRIASSTLAVWLQPFRAWGNSTNPGKALGFSVGSSGTFEPARFTAARCCDPPCRRFTSLFSSLCVAVVGAGGLLVLGFQLGVLQ